MASTKKCLTPAAGYVRRSDKKQEMSIKDQRREITRYADRHGYRIVQWYIDDGISGDATEKRREFQRMVAEAQSGGGFQVILCSDQDRFGRFDSVEAGFWIHPLRKAGVRLVTVTEGPIDWPSFAGRIVSAVKQEGKHPFLIDLSRLTARGQITAALAGWLTGRAAPYGYDRMIVDEAGTLAVTLFGDLTAFRFKLVTLTANLRLIGPQVMLQHDQLFASPGIGFDQLPGAFGELLVQLCYFAVLLRLAGRVLLGHFDQAVIVTFSAAGRRDQQQDG